MSEPMTTKDPAGGAAPSPHPGEAHSASLGSRLNWLRAGVLGANDGIVSTAGIVVGVAGASTSAAPVLVAGVAGALSMGGGEYVSVSTQADTHSAAIAKERAELDAQPQAELEELAGMYRQRGLSPDLAHQVAVELSERDALAAHAQIELGIDPYERANPWQAALTSCWPSSPAPCSHCWPSPCPPWPRGCPSPSPRSPALVITGWASARLGDAPARPAIARNVVVGLLAMGITFAIGTLVGSSA